MTPQEQRDQDYLEGYGVGLGHSLTNAELHDYTLAFVRGYRDARVDVFNSMLAATMRPAGGEPA